MQSKIKFKKDLLILEFEKYEKITPTLVQGIFQRTAGFFPAFIRYSDALDLLKGLEHKGLLKSNGKKTFWLKPMDTTPKQYETKDSGEREEYESGMRRDIQAGKPDFFLLFPEDMPYGEQPITRLAALMERGAVKYGRRNWQLACSAEELERFKSSAYRHFVQWLTSETDEDHMAAVMFNLIAAEHTKFMMEDKEG